MLEDRGSNYRRAVAVRQFFTWRGFTVGAIAASLVSTGIVLAAGHVWDGGSDAPGRLVSDEAAGSTTSTSPPAQGEPTSSSAPRQTGSRAATTTMRASDGAAPAAAGSPYQLVIDNTFHHETGTPSLQMARYPPDDPSPYFRTIGTGYNGSAEVVDEYVGDGGPCVGPYVQWLVDGLRAGTYSVELHVPDIDDLSEATEIGGQTVSLAANRGRWMPLDPVSAYQGYNGRYYLVVQQHPMAYEAGRACEATGRVVSFDALRLTLR